MISRYLFVFLFVFLWCIIQNSLFAKTCYVVIEKAGNLNPKIVESLSVSLISKYIRKVKPAPRFGIKMDECTFDVSFIESMSGMQYIFSGPNINSMGSSKQPGIDGLTQSLLRALSRSSDGSEIKAKICNDYPDLMVQDCRSIEAVVMIYNERGELIPNGSSVREGDAFFIMLQPMADAYAVVFNKDSKGNFFRIFPNHQVSSHSNPLRSNQQYFFPPRNSDLIFKFDENPGEETFYFVVSSTPLNDIDSVYNSIESGMRGLSSVLEQRINKRGITIGKKKQSVNTGYSKLPTSVDILKGKGAIVKIVTLRHVR